MRLGAWQRILVYGSLAAVASSGLLWFLLHDFFGDEVGPTTRLLLVTHGIASFAALIAFGSLLPLHVRSGWLRKRKRITGAIMIVVFSALTLTALVLYYGSEESHLWARWAHIGVGLFWLGAFPLHIACGQIFHLSSRP